MAIDIARTTVRSLLAATFIADGVDAIFNADKHAEIFQRFAPVLEKAGAPPVLTADARTLSRLAGGATITAGLCLSVGKHPRLSALTLAGMSVGIAVVNNPIWAETDKEERQSSALDFDTSAGYNRWAISRGYGPGRQAVFCLEASEP